MADNQVILENQSKAFACGSRPAGVRSHLRVKSPSGVNVRQAGLDKILETTLFNFKAAESLTRRETEILRLIVAGKTNKKIAQKLYRTERTVEYHRNRLMQKLGAHNAAELVKRAITIGIA